MTQDEIIEMARQAGMVQDGDVWFSANNYEQSDVHTAELKYFAKLVAAKEREACAKVCEGLNLYGGSESRQLQRATLKDCAYAIRARAQADRGEA